jgi:hypothetical protein
VDIDMIVVTGPLLINGFSPFDARSAAVARLMRAAEAVVKKSTQTMAPKRSPTAG